MERMLDFYYDFLSPYSYRIHPSARLRGSGGSRRCECLVTRYGKFLLLSPRLYRSLCDSYKRNHFWVTAIGQTVPTVRIYLALPAGVIGVSIAPFIFATALGTLAWNAPLIALGYLLRGAGWTPQGIGLTFGLAILVIEIAVLLRSLRCNES
jgi:membrane protein DedA with SNARE-associated domain